MQYNVGFKIKNMNNLLTKKIENLFSKSEFPFISFSSFRVLEFIFGCKNKCVTQKQIESEFKINRATTSKMLLQLEKKGFIERQNNPKDSRSKTVHLTDSGIKIYNHHIEVIKEFNSRFENVMNQDEFIQFENLYNKICKVIEE